MSMKFSAFNLKEEFVNNLTKLGYNEPTKVQEVVIPKALKGENIIVSSATGSGKTHSFLVPIINNLDFNEKLEAIIIAPTRELARQIYNFANEFKQFYPSLIVKNFISGVDYSRDLKSMNNGANIIIATPGKLNSLLKDSSINLSTIKTLVLDEADMLMEQGFIEDIESIINKCSVKPQIEVFSATISKRVESFLKKFIDADYTLTLKDETPTSSTVNHYLINTKHKNINDLVLKFLKIKNPYLLLIFASLKKKKKKMYEFLSMNGYKVGILSGDLESRERKTMLRRINNDEFRIVVCSDIASRGLDILDVSDVLSLNLPSNLEYYYHRAGRTGRNFKSGNSYIFYDSDHTKEVFKLIDSGLKLQYLKFSDDSLVEDLPLIKQVKKNKKIDTELKKDIEKAKYEAKSDKVKPNYKKKVKLAVDKVKRKHRREIIKKDIRRQREERYKQNGNK